MSNEANTQMKVSTGKYIFKYEGDMEYISLNTLLTSQFHFSQALSEIQTVLHPNDKLDIQVKALPKGSWQIELLINLNIFQQLFTADVAGIAEGVIGTFANITTIIEFLGGSKPKEVEKGSNVTTITNNKGSKITVNNNYYNVYANNPRIEKEITETFKPIEQNDSIEGVKLIDTKSDENVLDIDRHQFPHLIRSNEIFESTSLVEHQHNVNLTIFKLVFEPGYKWQFIKEGKKISCFVEDEDFLTSIQDGKSFSYGDILVCNLDVEKYYDEKLNVWIEKTYRIQNVLSHIPRSQQASINFDPQPKKDDNPPMIA